MFSKKNKHKNRVNKTPNTGLISETNIVSPTSSNASANIQSGDCLFKKDNEIEVSETVKESVPQSLIHEKDVMPDKPKRNKKHKHNKLDISKKQEQEKSIVEKSDSRCEVNICDINASITLINTDTNLNEKTESTTVESIACKNEHKVTQSDKDINLVNYSQVLEPKTICETENSVDLLETLTKDEVKIVKKRNKRKKKSSSIHLAISNTAESKRESLTTSEAVFEINKQLLQENDNNILIKSEEKNDSIIVNVLESIETEDKPSDCIEEKCKNKKREEKINNERDIVNLADDDDDQSSRKRMDDTNTEMLIFDSDLTKETGKCTAEDIKSNIVAELIVTDNRIDACRVKERNKSESVNTCSEFLDIKGNIEIDSTIGQPIAEQVILSDKVEQKDYERGDNPANLSDIVEDLCMIKKRDLTNICNVSTISPILDVSVSMDIKTSPETFMQPIIENTTIVEVKLDDLNSECKTVSPKPESTNTSDLKSQLKKEDKISSKFDNSDEFSLSQVSKLIDVEAQYNPTNSITVDANNNNMIASQTGTAVTTNQYFGITDALIENSPVIHANTLLKPITKATEKTTFGEPHRTDKKDLKSKVLKVNQDMEELKLSIEKSLAEFKALEQSEAISDQINLETTSSSLDCKQHSKSTLSTTNTAEDIFQSSKSTISTDSHMNIDTQCIKGKEKSKKKSKQKVGVVHSTSSSSSTETSKNICSSSTGKNESAHKSNESTQKDRQQTTAASGDSCTESTGNDNVNVESNNDDKELDTREANIESDRDNLKNEKITQPQSDTIERFEDAMTSSIDDINTTFELIVRDDNGTLNYNNPDIRVTSPTDDEKEKKVLTPPKNLLGHPDIPVSSSKTDYKKEKNKTLNCKQAKVRIKDSVEIEKGSNRKHVSESLQEYRSAFITDKPVNETISCIFNGNEEYIYKYTFRKVFLPNVCHICRNDLKLLRIPCEICHLIFYCSKKHKDEGWPGHQAFCFAISTLANLKNQKHIYGDAKNVTGQGYRVLRMQTIVSCEKLLNRKLVPWEQECLLYPRICSETSCREYRQETLKDCVGCGQVFYCFEKPEHLSAAHQRWCKSYSLYEKLVKYQQMNGRVELKLPTRVITETSEIPDNVNNVLASLYQEKIDMNDIQYAALTQLATSPLTAAYCYQLYTNRTNLNGIHKKSHFTIHLLGAELQFEADGLNKWEIFFLHLYPEINALSVVFINSKLNPSNLPLDLIGKIKLCDDCVVKNRGVVFSFQEMIYEEYLTSDDFLPPDIVCAFDVGSAGLEPAALKGPQVMAVSASSARAVEAAVKGMGTVLVGPRRNPFASARPDRNFITDDEMPLLYKNYYYAILCPS